MTRRLTLASMTSVRLSFTKIAFTCFSIARFERYSSSAIAWFAVPARDVRERLELPRRQVRERRLLGTVPVRDEAFHDLRVDHRPAIRHRPDRRDELAPAMDVLLEEIRAPVRPVREQCESVLRLGVLAQEHDPDLWMRDAQLGRDLEALVGGRRRHADVGHDDVEGVDGDRLLQRGTITAAGDDVDAVVFGEDVLQRFANEEAVVGERDAKDRLAAPRRLARSRQTQSRRFRDGTHHPARVKSRADTRSPGGPSHCAGGASDGRYAG